MDELLWEGREGAEMPDLVCECGCTLESAGPSGEILYTSRLSADNVRENKMGVYDAKRILAPRRKRKEVQAQPACRRKFRRKEN